MRFGTWRGVTLAIALAAAVLADRPARANDFLHPTIPKQVDAIDLNTGSPYYAPPIPYGHYAKGGLLGKAFGHGLGLGGLGHGLGGLGHGLGCGCGLCGGRGLGLGFGHGLGHGCGDPGCGGHGGKRLKDCGLCGGKGCGICTSSIMPSPQAVAVAPGPMPSGQVAINPHCGGKGCGLGFGHKHDHGGSIFGDAGCHHGAGEKCGKCSGLGLGLGGGCSNCGGLGCGLCGLGSKAHGLLTGLLHPGAGKIKWFVGPGGPVPLTPGYVPYVNPVRAPRDFLSFPPFTPER